MPPSLAGIPNSAAIAPRLGRAEAPKPASMSPEVCVVPAEAVPVVAAGIGKQGRHGSAVCQRTIAQDRQVEAAAIEADQHRSVASIVARQGCDKIAYQIGRTFVTDVPGAEAAHDVSAIVLALGEEGAAVQPYFYLEHPRVSEKANNEFSPIGQCIKDV